MKTKVMDHSYITFHQSMPGGFSVIDDYVTLNVIFKIKNSLPNIMTEEALNKALDIGIYFDGVHKGLDCKCCSDRWSAFEAEDHNEEPMVIGSKLKDYIDCNKDAFDKDKNFPIVYLYTSQNRRKTITCKGVVRYDYLTDDFGKDYYGYGIYEDGKYVKLKKGLRIEL